MRSDWTALPESVTAGIAGRVGGNFDVTPASSGNHAEIAWAVTGPAGWIFVKAASGELSVRSLQYELAATQTIDRHPPQSCGSSNPMAGWWWGPSILPVPTPTCHPAARTSIYS
ncbi:hypothetical protein [Micromonospora sp. LH3U1]|uniref:hypothetical protein n=1 Tax=Micromonospora sp. LH3U1 TaxID=3018339 RepID=UPI00300E30E0